MILIDRKNILLIISVIVVVGIIGVYIPYVQNQQYQETLPVLQEGQNDASVIVQYTNKGFEPNEITVTVGTSIEWVSQTEKLMWVASDPHPAHVDLPGFDERGVEGNHGEKGAQTKNRFFTQAYAHGAGSSYMYTFQEIGTWKYHNHLNPSDRGTVIVVP